jgi:hypothetical protein
MLRWRRRLSRSAYTSTCKYIGYCQRALSSRFIRFVLSFFSWYVSASFHRKNVIYRNILSHLFFFFWIFLWGQLSFFWIIYNTHIFLIEFLSSFADKDLFSFIWEISQLSSTLRSKFHNKLRLKSSRIYRKICFYFLDFIIRRFN